MLLHVLSCVHHAPESLAQVLLEQARDELTHIDGDLRWEIEEANCDPTINFVWVLIVEGRVARQHFKDENAQRPPVHPMVVTDRHDYLRREILWSPTQSERPVINLLREAKVCYFHVPVGSHEQVLRFEVPIRDLLLMEVLKGQNYLCDVK